MSFMGPDELLSCRVRIHCPTCRSEADPSVEQQAAITDEPSGLALNPFTMENVPPVVASNAILLASQSHALISPDEEPRMRRRSDLVSHASESTGDPQKIAAARSACSTTIRNQAETEDGTDKVDLSWARGRKHLNPHSIVGRSCSKVAPIPGKVAGVDCAAVPWEDPTPERHRGQPAESAEEDMERIARLAYLGFEARRNSRSFLSLPTTPAPARLS